MSNVVEFKSPRPWKNYEKIIFRIAFVFFIAMSIPNSPEWYVLVFNIDWTNLHYRDLYDIARFGSGINFFGNKIFGSPLLGYATWVITLFFSIIIGFIWTGIVYIRKKNISHYHLQYYWLRVVVRYRAGIGIIGFGFTKLLPVQMPYPSFGLLNTNFGDFTAQKIFWLSVGSVPWYQIFTGIVEVGAGAMLLFRKTTTLGAVLLFGALGDIVYVNFAYDGGVHVYSTYFVLLSGFLLVKDIPQLYNLLILEKPTFNYSFYPSFYKKWQQYTRIGLKTLTLIVFLGVFFWLQYVNFRYDPYKQPSSAGVKQLRGNYQVSEFRINNQLLPYDPADSVRWSEATFEKWTTLTFRTNKENPIDLSNGGGASMKDINRTFELTGTGGGQRVFHYYADTIDRVLYLQDKYFGNRRGEGAEETRENAPSGSRNNQKKSEEKKQSDNWISEKAWAHIGNEVKFIDDIAKSTRRDREFARTAGKFDERNRMILSYESQNEGNRVILKGINEHKDSIYVVLDRIEKRYTLPASTLSAGNYD